MWEKVKNGSGKAKAVAGQWNVMHDLSNKAKSLCVCQQRTSESYLHWKGRVKMLQTCSLVFTRLPKQQLFSSSIYYFGYGWICQRNDVFCSTKKLAWYFFCVCQVVYIFLLKCALTLQSLSCFWRTQTDDSQLACFYSFASLKRVNPCRKLCRAASSHLSLLSLCLWDIWLQASLGFH